MSYGIKFRVQGKDFFVNNWTPFNYIDSFELAAGEGSGSRSYSLASGRSIKVFGHNHSSGVVRASYSFSVSGNTVSWVMNSSNSSATVTVIGGL